MIIHQSNQQGYLIANNIGSSAGEKLAGNKQVSSYKPLNRGETLKKIGEHLTAVTQFFTHGNFYPLTSSDTDAQKLKNPGNSQISPQKSIHTKEEVMSSFIAPNMSKEERKKINGSLNPTTPLGLRTDNNNLTDLLNRIDAGMSEEDKRKLNDSFKHRTPPGLKTDNGNWNDPLHIKPGMSENDRNRVNETPDRHKDNLVNKIIDGGVKMQFSEVGKTGNAGKTVKNKELNEKPQYINSPTVFFPLIMFRCPALLLKYL